LVRDGDRIRLSVKDRTIDLLVDEAALAERSREWERARPPKTAHRGYDLLYAEHVTQADMGCDFDFLR
jgi:dihydroxy-acid dehydratase